MAVKELSKKKRGIAGKGNINLGRKAEGKVGPRLHLHMNGSVNQAADGGGGLTKPQC